MQTSGTFPQLSDGVRKTITTSVPAPAKAVKIAAPKPAAATTHRRGGFAKHAKAGK